MRVVQFSHCIPAFEIFDIKNDASHLLIKESEQKNAKEKIRVGIKIVCVSIKRAQTD
jgi:hypothetical protein